MKKDLKSPWGQPCVPETQANGKFKNQMSFQEGGDICTPMVNSC